MLYCNSGVIAGFVAVRWFGVFVSLPELAITPFPVANRQIYQRRGDVYPLHRCAARVLHAHRERILHFVVGTSAQRPKAFQHVDYVVEGCINRLFNYRSKLLCIRWQFKDREAFYCLSPAVLHQITAERVCRILSTIKTIGTPFVVGPGWFGNAHGVVAERWNSHTPDQKTLTAKRNCDGHPALDR